MHVGGAGVRDWPLVLWGVVGQRLMSGADWSGVRFGPLNSTSLFRFVACWSPESVLRLHMTTGTEGFQPITYISQYAVACKCPFRYHFCDIEVADPAIVIEVHFLPLRMDEAKWAVH